jgi:regulator of replication initiation timing
MRRLEHDLNEEQSGDKAKRTETLQTNVATQRISIARLQADLKEKREENWRLASEHTKMRNKLQDHQSEIARLN